MKGTDVAVTHDSAAERFEIDVDGQVAFLEYSRADGRLDLRHTEVPPALRGRGYAEALARAGLEYAKREQLRVVPSCSVVRTYVERHPEYVALLAED